MDPLTLPSPEVKCRRRHSPEFKKQVVRASYEPGASIAGVAREHQINANLLHKWRKEYPPVEGGEFVRLPVPGHVGPSTQREGDTVRMELPGGIVVHWPLYRVGESVAWIKALMS